MITAILAVFLFVVLIFPHELGHFIAAKSVGVQVNEFAFGMGPALWKKQRGETQYSIRAFPIGGYCAMEGESEDSENPRALNNQSAAHKLIILFAGSVMNVLIAVLIMSILMGVLGEATTTIGKVNSGYPAAEAGVRAGDQLVSADGKAISKWSELSASLNSSDTVRLVVSRDGQEKTFDITPVKENDRYLIGVSPRVSHNPVIAVKNGCIASWNMTIKLYESLKMLFTGEAKAKDLSGPVGMVSLVHQTVSMGLTTFFYLMALISLNLAVINLLPLPALDGGRILFVIIRMFTGKAITDRQEAAVHAAGMGLLLALMVLVTWNDITRLF